MLTKEEHIKYWLNTAKKDWRAVQNMYKSRDYLPALFFAHLVLEKLCKAHWVKDNVGNTPPKIHNLNTITERTKLELSDEIKNFLFNMNQFQLEGRYPDYKDELYKKYKAVATKKILDEVDTVRKCLLRKYVIEHLKKIAGEIQNTGLHLDKMVLYGSYAKGKQHKWSDIDVAFIADKFIGIGFEDTKLFSGVMIRYPKLNIQPRTYNTKDFTADKDPFVEEILRTGIEIKA